MPPYPAQRLPRWLTALVLALAAFLIPTAAALSQAAPPGAATLVVKPASVEIPRFGGEVQASVFARTPDGAPPPPDLTLGFSAPPGVAVVVGPKTPGPGQVSWLVTLSAKGDPEDAGSIDFHVTRPGGARAGLPAPASLTIAVAPGRTSSPAEDIELAIKTDFGTITETSAAGAYLVVKNKAKYPLSVEALRVDSPRFLSVWAIELDDGRRCPSRGLKHLRTSQPLTPAVSVPPHGTVRIPLCLDMGTPRIGDWLLLADATVARTQGGAVSRGEAFAEQKVTVGVPGVSDVLKVLDVPSLLIVPGALILGTWSLLLGGAAASQPGWLQFKTSSFWIAAVTLSIVIFAALKLLPGTPDFLFAFSLTSVAFLWVGCVGGAGLTYFGWRGVLEYQRRQREPLETDKPLQILRKLKRAGAGFYLAPVEVTQATQKQKVFVLPFAAPEGKAWVVPKIKVAAGKAATGADEAVKAVMALNDHSTGLQALIDAAARRLEAGRITLTWEEGLVQRPALRGADQLSKPGVPASPLEKG